jgi:uncharacterized protein (DUF934 family)
MSEIIRNDAVVADDWKILRPSADAPLSLPLSAARAIVPLAFWIEHHADLASRDDIGVWLAPDEDPARLSAWLEGLPLIAVDFPKFTDGRGYSSAFLLRSRLGYKGELRAIGEVLPDQLFYLWRVGFNAFAVRPDKDIRKALQSLKPFSDAYQGSWDNAVPAYRRHERAWPAAPEAA